MNKSQLWQSVLAEIELNTSPANFATWFKQTSVFSKKDSVITIQVPNAFTKEWLENKYNKFIFKTIRSFLPEIKEINYTIHQPKPKILSFKKTPSLERQLDISQIKINKETNLNPRYTFESFVVGSFNELANAASQAVVKSPGRTYNPLFIYGGVGLGKTHLLQSIGNEITKNKPSFRVIYLPSERFTSELVSSIRSKTVNNLKQKYQKMDVLILDDVQFLGGKEKTQEEFFHIFNCLYEKNKQIILSSDCPPKSISTLEERLRSRFEGGMIADIGYPDFETRVAILKTKIQEKNVQINDGIINFIAENITNNIREIEGALNRVIASNSLSTLSLEEAKRNLKKIITPLKTITNFKNIIKTVCEFYDILEKNLIAKSRKKEVVYPRQVAMYLVREELKNSYPSIGDRFGKRDHTTVIYACEKIEKELQKEEKLFQEISIIRQRLYK